MNTAILAHGPEFASTENLVPAFSLRGICQLICLKPSDWRHYDAGLVLADEQSRERALALCDTADLLVIADAISFVTLAAIGGKDWLSHFKGKQFMVFFGDTYYLHYPEFYEGICQALGIERVFVMPDLIHLSRLSAIPLHQPQRLLDGEKDMTVSIVHSPGTHKKVNAKGTVIIEEIITELQEAGYEFRYNRLMHLTLADCLAMKSQADIVIDQIPVPGWPTGLGRSGLEGMAAGAATLGSIYEPERVADFFEYPGMIRVLDRSGLRDVLVQLLDDPHARSTWGWRGRKWVEETLTYEPWLQYVEKYL